MKRQFIRVFHSTFLKSQLLALCLLASSSAYAQSLATNPRRPSKPHSQAIQAGTVAASKLSPSGPAGRARLEEGYGKLPLSFEPNQGQASLPVELLSYRHGNSLLLTPTTAGSLTGMIAATDGTAGVAGSRQAVTLSDDSAQPVAGFSASSLTFTSQLVGSTSAAQPVTLSNTGAGPLTITGILVTGDFAQANNCGTLLAVEASCTLNVTFTPGSPGARTGTLTLFSDASNGTQTVALSGTGTVLTTNTLVGFMPHVDFPTGDSPYSAATGDFNGDSRLDLAVANYNAGSVSVLLGNGNGTFQARVDYATGQSPTSVAVGDFNGDSKPDVAVANYYDGTVSILLGNGDGTFQGHVDYPVGSNPRTVIAGDFNGDGKLDLAVTNSYGNTVSILLGNGDGTFGTAATYATGAYPLGLVAADFNGDGKLDLATTNADGYTVSILLGSGDGTFQTNVDYPTGSYPYGLVAADFNGDGMVDLAAADYYDNALSVFLGNGDGTFQPHVTYSTGSGPSWLSARDLNGDGKFDLVVSNEGDNTVSVLLGNGDGTFQARRDFATGASPIGVATGDFNGDGAPDIVTANFGASSVSVLLNTAALVAPASLTFTDQLVGTASGAQTITLTNASATHNLNVTSVTITGTNSTDFVASSDGCSGASVPPVASCSISVKSAPTTFGTLTATLSIADNAVGSPQSVSLSGYGVSGGAVGMSSSSVAFPDTLVGTTSAPIDLTLTNTGSNPLGNISISTSANFGQTNTCPAGTSTLAHNASCTISMTFSPTTGGAFSGTLTISSDASSTATTVALSGNGIAPAVTLSASELDFGKRIVNTTSSPMTITLTNTGNATLHITGITVSGDFLASGDCSGAIAVNQSCTISVTFSPTTVTTIWGDNPQAGTLTINDDAPNAPQTASLTGYGAAAGGLVVQDLTTFTPTDLATALVGSGVSISNVTYTGVPIAAGEFTGGASIIGFDSGIILSNGSVFNAIGPNISDSITMDNGEPGDADLNTLIPGYTTYDAAVLEFDFVPTNSTLTFQYVFSSDEYNEWVHSSYNDVFGFFVNGTNIALIPGTTTPVSINNLNGGNPLGTDAQNSQFFINNDVSDGGGQVNTEMDGLTVVLTAQATVNPNQVNHIKLAIADAGDHVLDSNVFIRSGSFASSPISLSAGTLAFGNQLISTTSAPQSLILTNTGTVTVNITGVSVTGPNSSDFAVSDNGCIPSGSPSGSLAAGATCTISITFTPSGLGLRTGSLNITSDAGNPSPVGLTGTGISTNLLTFVPEVLNFGSVQVGTTSDPLTLVITNNGAATVTFSSFSLTGPFTLASESESCSSLAPTARCTLTFTFTPLEAGGSSGTLTVTSTAPTSPNVIPLNGNGVTQGGICPTKPTPVAQVGGHAVMAKANLAAKPDPARRKHLLENYGRLPLSFEPNQGQTDPRVRFLSRGSGYNLFLTPTDALLVLRKPSVGRGAESNAALLRMALVGADSSPSVTGLEELTSKSNYFIGNDPSKWRTGVPNYAKVRYAGVYPGIDLVFYGSERQLEYDFVVAPGADPKAITLALDGTLTLNRLSAMTIDSRGDVVLRLAGGDVRFRKPVVYQSTLDAGLRARRRTVEGRYVLLADNRIGFEVSTYDRSQPLIIDPVLSYSSYLGGSAEDVSLGIAVDSAGSAYVTGGTRSANFPTTPGAFQTTHSTDTNCSGGTQTCVDVFVAKFQPDGSGLVYSTFIGGSQEDTGFGITLDADGNAYIDGTTKSPDFPVTPGAAGTKFQGGTCSGASGTFTCDDAFVTKLSAGGSTLVFSSYLGSDAEDGARGVAIDSACNVYMSGFTAAQTPPAGVSGFQETYGGGVFDATVMKLGASGGQLLYFTYLGGSGLDLATGIAVDGSGNAYVTGITSSANFPTANALQSAFGGGTYDAFVAKLDPEGETLFYSTFLGGSGDESGYGITVDSAGSAYVDGLTNSGNFPTQNPFQSALAGGFDSFLTKLSPAGSALVYSTYFGGNGDEGLTESGGIAVDKDGIPMVYGGNIAVDSGGNAYVAGMTNSTNLLTPNGVQTSAGGGTCGTALNTFPCRDAFVAKVNSSGSGLLFATYLGGNVDDAAVGIAVDASGNAYVTGVASSPNFPVTSGAFQSAYAGPTCNDFTAHCGDGFVVKLSSLAVPLVAVTPTTLDFGTQDLGITSSPLTVTVANSGDAALTISTITITGTNNGDFAISDDGCITSGSSGTVPAGGSCTVGVTFTPSASGTRSATLTITDSGGNTYTVALSGTGMAPVVSLDVSSLSFKHNINLECPPKAVTLTINGTGPLTITSIATSGPFTATNTCGVGPGSGVVAAGASCQILVTFTPPNIGNFSGDLTITDNASNNPQTVTLAGQGVAACVLQSPNQAARLLRGAETTTFTVSDPSPSCHGSTISLACVGNNPATCAFNPATIPPTGSSVVTVGNLQALGVDTLSFQATGTSGAGTTAVALRVLLADFFFTTYPATATVAAGEGTSYSLTVAPENGLAGNLALSCQGAPAGATCAVSPGTVALDGVMPMQAHVKVTTTARSLGLPGGSGEGQPSGWPLLVWALALLATLAAAWRARAWAVGALSPFGREGRVALGGLVLGASLVWVLVWAACGGGSNSISNPGGGTPPGTYTLTVTGTYTATTGQVNTLSHTTTLTLHVK